MFLMRRILRKIPSLRVARHPTAVADRRGYVRAQRICVSSRSSERLQVLSQDCNFLRDIAIHVCVAGETTVAEY